MESEEKRVSWAEYLALEGVTDDDRRLDYSHGVVLAQGAPSQDHETIVSNLTLLLGPAIRARGCRFYMKQTVRRAGEFSHDPDFLVSCAAADLGPGEHRKRGRIEHPAFIVEVLSPSTRAFDLDDKVTNYSTYSSLLHYVIVDTARQRVTHFHRDAGDEEFRRLVVRDRLVCGGFTPPGGVLLSELYDGTYVPALTALTDQA
jgi:Uma2 family endonuclease